MSNELNTLKAAAKPFAKWSKGEEPENLPDLSKMKRTWLNGSYTQAPPSITKVRIDSILPSLGVSVLTKGEADELREIQTKMDKTASLRIANGHAQVSKMVKAAREAFAEDPGNKEALDLINNKARVQRDAREKKRAYAAALRVQSAKAMLICLTVMKRILATLDAVITQRSEDEKEFNSFLGIDAGEDSPGLQALKFKRRMVAGEIATGLTPMIHRDPRLTLAGLVDPKSWNCPDKPKELLPEEKPRTLTMADGDKKLIEAAKAEKAQQAKGSTPKGNRLVRLEPETKRGLKK